MTCDNICPGCPLGEPVKAGEVIEVDGVGVKINTGKDGIYCLDKDIFIETEKSINLIVDINTNTS